MTGAEEAAGDGAGAGAGEGSAADRRTWLRRLAATTAFAAPVVASFTMDGLALSPTPAGAAVPSPWSYQGSFRATSGGASYAWLPRASYLTQNTAFPTAPVWLTLLDPGATGVLVEFTVLLNRTATGVDYFLNVDGVTVDSAEAPPGRYSKQITLPTPTTAPVGVEISFATISLPAVGIDDVVVQGIYP